MCVHAQTGTESHAYARYFVIYLYTKYMNAIQSSQSLFSCKTDDNRECSKSCIDCSISYTNLLYGPILFFFYLVFCYVFNILK